MRVILLLFLAVFPETGWAQVRSIRPGLEVRAYNDSTEAVVTGRVAYANRDVLAIEETLGAIPTRLRWRNVHRLELRIEGEWRAISTDAQSEPLDTSWAAGALAGADAARRRPEFGYGTQTFLLTLPVGFFGWCFFADCGLTYKVMPAAGLGLVGIVWGAAERRADNISAELQRYDFPDRSVAYTTGYREGYEKTIRSRFRKQVLGGALLGSASGFAILVALWTGYD